MSILKLNGMLVYACIDEPKECFDKEKGWEYKCGVVVDEDTADSFAEQFPKQAARKVKRTDFEQMYKVAPPEGTEKNLYVITLKKNSQITDKKTNQKIDLPIKYRPRAFQPKGKVLVDITNTNKIGNGSFGTVSYEVGETKYGNIARLKNVLVEELVEYVSAGGSDYEAGSEFGLAVASDDNGGEVKVPAKNIQKTVAKKNQPVFDEDPESSPF
jgi:hypothetical protein